MAAPDSVPAPRPWVLRYGGQGLEWGRGAGRVHALHLLPEAGPEAGSDRVDYHGDLSVAQKHGGCGFEEECEKAVPSVHISCGPTRRVCSGLAMVVRGKTTEFAEFVLR